MCNPKDIIDYPDLRLQLVGISKRANSNNRYEQEDGKGAEGKGFQSSMDIFHRNCKAQQAHAINGIYHATSRLPPYSFILNQFSSELKDFGVRTPYQRFILT